MVDHLRKQKAFSFEIVGKFPDGKPIYQCAYRGYDGTKCAVGCLIPDDVYSPFMENKTPKTDNVRLAIGWDEDFALFLSDAQHQLHDSLWSGIDGDMEFDMNKFEDSARRFAAKHELKYRPPTQHA